jgi:hypothetical protein
MVGTLTSTAWLRVVLFSDFFEAWTFSWMLMIRVSPTKRARRSSNSGRAEATLKMAPLLGAIVGARFRARRHRLMHRRRRRGGDAAGQRQGQPSAGAGIYS